MRTNQVIVSWLSASVRLVFTCDTLAAICHNRTMSSSSRYKGIKPSKRETTYYRILCIDGAPKGAGEGEGKGKTKADVGYSRGITKGERRRAVGLLTNEKGERRRRIATSKREVGGAGRRGRRERERAREGRDGGGGRGRWTAKGKGRRGGSGAGTKGEGGRKR